MDLFLWSHLVGGRLELGGVILMYWNKLRLVIQQNITIFVGVHT